MSPSQEILEFSARLRDEPRLFKESSEFSADHFGFAKVEPPRVRPNYQILLRIRSAKGFTLVRGIETGGISSRLRRSAAQIGKDGRDGFHLVMNGRGNTISISQCGRSQRVEPESFTLVSEADPCWVENSGRGHTWTSVVLIMPREPVDHRLSAGQRYCLRSFGGTQAFRSLLLGAFSSLGQRAWNLTTSEFLSAASSLTDLFLLALDGSPDLLSREQSVRSANLDRAKRIIRNRLSDPDLSLATIATEAGISLSYLHQLFREHGQTAYEFLKSERLQRARYFLSSSSPSTMSISEASLRCGFSDKSYFSRAFKRAFGATPREVAERS